MKDKIISLVGTIIVCLVIFFYFLSKNIDTQIVEKKLNQATQQTQIETGTQTNINSYKSNEEKKYQLKPKIVVFYTKWCSACQEFMPILSKLENSYKNNFEFIRLNIDDPANSLNAELYRVKSIPKVFYVNDKYNIKIEIAHYADFDAMKKELDYYKDYIQ